MRPFLTAIGLVCLAQPAIAADPAAQFVTKLFIETCVPNLGQPSKVVQWAQLHQLAPITDPIALNVFVGPGANGVAWAIPVAQGSFALSIRGTTEACAVWARLADPGEALADFRQVMEGVRRPGINVTVAEDVTSHSPFGDAHELVYIVAAPGAPNSFVFTLLTAERPGGAFQVSMQAAQAQ